MHQCIIESRSDNEKRNAKGEKIKALKARLNAKISEPLIPRGISRKYITSIHGDLPSVLLQNQGGEGAAKSMPALRKSTAIDELKAKVLKKIMKKSSN